VTKEEMRGEIARLSAETMALQGIIVVLFQKMLATPGGFGPLAFGTLKEATDYVENVSTVCAYKGIGGHHAAAVDVLKHIDAMVAGNKPKPKKGI
jgi:hypothetical protein